MPSPAALTDTIADIEIGYSARVEHEDGVVEGEVYETQRGLERDRQQNSHIIYIDTDDLSDEYSAARIDVWPREGEVVDPILKKISHEGTRELRHRAGEIVDVEILEENV